MGLTTILSTGTVPLTEIDRRRITRQMRKLEQRLVHHPSPIVSLALSRHPQRRQVDVSLRVQVGPLGLHLVSHQHSRIATHAVRLAIEDVERQLERLHASLTLYQRS